MLSSLRNVVRFQDGEEKKKQSYSVFNSEPTFTHCARSCHPFATAGFPFQYDDQEIVMQKKHSIAFEHTANTKKKGKQRGFMLTSSHDLQQIEFLMLQ